MQNENSNVTIAFNTMDLTKKMAELVGMRDKYQHEEDTAHAWVVEYNARIRKLEKFQKEALELFGPTPPELVPPDDVKTTPVVLDDDQSGTLDYSADKWRNLVDGPNDHFSR